jgi:hypothetical protein
MPITPNQPQAQPQQLYSPEQIPPLLLEEFGGVDTNVLRSGVDSKMAYWIDGFMPFGHRNLRTLYDLGSTVYTRTGSASIIFFDFYVINGVPYMIVFQSDGSATQVNLSTLAVTVVLPAGTITFPSILNVGTSQWAQQYLLIVANQANGYWVWDGRVLYTAGTLAPVIVLTSTGNGYSTPPAVIVSGGSGSGATIVAAISNGQVVGATVANSGSGYLATDSITLTFSGGTVSGSGGSITVVMGSFPGGSGATGAITSYGFLSTAGGVYFWNIQGVTVTAGGSGYSQFARVNFISTQAIINAQAAPSVTGGVISAVTMSNLGEYATSGAFFPTVTVIFSDTGYAYVASASVVATGTGYSPNPSVTVSGGSSPTAQAVIRANIANGTISSAVVNSGGFYASVTPTPTVTITDNPSNATATATLMPFGIQGTSVETFQQYVWIIKQAVVFNSAAGSVSDFATSDGGGNKTSPSSVLRSGYTRLKAANGQLYLFADSSIDYISQVNTSGSTVISTTYQLLNADPESGTPYPQSVITYGRGLMFCNAFGIHVIYGSEAKKISDPMNGVYTTISNFGGQQLSTAQHTFLGRKINAALVPIMDPITQMQTNKLLCWDGKRWFASNQSKQLQYIKSQEFNSQITAYGTDGYIIAPLFTTPSQSFTKTVVSRLWDVGGYWQGVGASRLWGLLQTYDPTYSPVNVTIDNEQWNPAIGLGSSSVVNVLSAPVVWTNNVGVVANWTNNASAPAIWENIPVSPGTFVSPPEAVGQAGVLLGITLSTTHKDMAVISLAVQPEIDQYRG